MRGLVEELPGCFVSVFTKFVNKRNFKNCCIMPSNTKKPNNLMMGEGKSKMYVTKLVCELGLENSNTLQ